MNYDPIARALTGMTAEGWAKFSTPAIKQNFEEQQAVQREAVQAQAAMVARVFGTPEGGQVLNMLVTNFLLHNLVRPVDERQTLEQQALYAARREGQNSVVASILNALAVARGEQPKLQEGT